MKKYICLVLCALLLCVLAIPASAAPQEPQITLEPQSPNYPNYSVALYTVKATGTNLTATWYMEWQGSTYTISNIGGAIQAWEPYAGESYGARQVDANTFTFIFAGIEADLNGAYIWCVLEDGHYSVTSQKARIWVGNENSPPTIVDIPARLEVTQGAKAEIRVIATAPEGTQLSYLWYETDTGKIEDIRAVNRGTETNDFLICDTSTVGKRTYVCFINTSDGGFTQTSFVPVTVTEGQAPQDMAILTTQLPEATAGNAYSARIACNDPNAKFVVSYNAGGTNDFDKTGLTLSADGLLTGTPTAPGTYGFTVCAAGDTGEDYMTYTLVIQETEAEPTTPGEEVTPTETPTEEPTALPPIPATAVPTAPGATASPTDTTFPTAENKDANAHTNNGMPWWVLVLIAVGAAGAGVVTALLLTRKKKA